MPSTATLVKVVPVSAPPPAAVAGSAVASESAGLDGKFAANVTLPDGSVIQVGSLQGSAKRWFPGCVNAAGKTVLKW